MNKATTNALYCNLEQVLAQCDEMAMTEKDCDNQR